MPSGLNCNMKKIIKLKTKNKTVEQKIIID